MKNNFANNTKSALNLHTYIDEDGQETLRTFENPKAEQSHVEKMFQNSVGTRKESCEWCQSGIKEHNWPEDGPHIYHTPNAFKLSISNFNHS